MTAAAERQESLGLPAVLLVPASLRLLLSRFLRRTVPQLKVLGYDDAFIRLWHFYFAYCEAGFLEKTIGVVQVRLEKAQYR